MNESKWAIYNGRVVRIVRDWTRPTIVDGAETKKGMNVDEHEIERIPVDARLRVMCDGFRVGYTSPEQWAEYVRSLPGHHSDYRCIRVKTL